MLNDADTICVLWIFIKMRVNLAVVVILLPPKREEHLYREILEISIYRENTI